MKFLDCFRDRKPAPAPQVHLASTRRITATIDDGKIRVLVETTQGTVTKRTEVTANATEGADHVDALRDVITQAVRAANNYEAVAGWDD